MVDIDREFALLAASVQRTARVQQAEVHRFLQTAPRRTERPLTEYFEEEEGWSGAAPAEPRLRQGEVLARHLAAAYSALCEHVDHRMSGYEALPDSEAKRGAVTEMRELVAGARSLHRSLGWLDAAREPPLDLGTRYLVDYLTAQLVVQEAEVTVVAGERSYGKVANPLSPVFALSGAEPPGEELAIVVYIPRREQRSGLLHPLIVHELGHAADDQHGLVQEVLEAANEDSELTSSLAGAAERRAEATGEDLGAAGQSLAARLEAWIEEAVCDAFAAQLLGPTYLYSFMAIVGTADLDQAGDEHPPTRQRIRLLLKALTELGWESVMTSTESIHSWFCETANVERDYGDIQDAFCVGAVDHLAPEIRAVVGRHVADLTFEATGYDPVHDEISDLLGAGIPPSQTVHRQRIDRPAIILGSWLFAVQRMGSDLPGLARAADVPELSSLLPKALQDAALLHAWEDAV